MCVSSPRSLIDDIVAVADDADRRAVRLLGISRREPGEAGNRGRSKDGLFERVGEDHGVGRLRWVLEVALGGGWMVRGKDVVEGDCDGGLYL